MQKAKVVDIDFTKSYSCPMVKKTDITHGIYMEVTVTPIYNKYSKLENIRVSVDDSSFEVLYFYPEYFSYLLYTGYIKII